MGCGKSAQAQSNGATTAKYAVETSNSNLSHPDLQITPPTPAPDPVVHRTDPSNAVQLGPSTYSYWSWCYSRYPYIGGHGHEEYSEQNTIPHELQPLQQISVQAQKTPVSIAAGDSHTLVLCEDASVWSWGNGRNGQLGHGSQDIQPTPTRVSTLTYANIRALAAGCHHSLALAADGYVWSWGDGSCGQLGNLSNDDQTLIQKKDGTIWKFGWDYGTGTVPAKNLTPIHVTGWQSPTMTSSSTLPHQNNNTTQTQGTSPGPTNPANGPPAPSSPSAASTDIQLAVGAKHCFILNHGALFCWGSNAQGQLGLGSDAGMGCNTPRQVPFPCSVTSVAAAKTHSVAACQDGSVWTWGNGKFGQLGLGDSCTTTTTPLKVDSLALQGMKITNVVAGGAHTVAFTEAGVWLWGSLAHKPSSSNQDSTPHQVDGVTGKSVLAAAGEFHVVMATVKSSGST